jgi:glucose/arabinose dehydrogenase
MRMRRGFVLSVLLVSLLAATTVLASPPRAPDAAQARQQGTYQLLPVVDGLNRPLFLTHAWDGSGRLFIVEQSGAIRVIENDTLLAEPFLDLSDRISPEALTADYTERGLLGLAFHPNYVENDTFFVNYTAVDGSTVLASYRVSDDDPNRADPASGTQIFTLAQPYANHNGGHLAFGPDGYLYMGLGDGGSGGDPQGNAQNLETLLGTIIRLDVDSLTGYTIPPDNPFVNHAAARPEIWAWGLRNPWRFSFDRQTGDLVIADVGQNVWEEVNFQPASSSGGENYGWNAYEGSHVYSGQNPASEVVMPVIEYSHEAGCSVTGGYVYRGAALPDLQGLYVFGDWCSGTIWAAMPSGQTAWPYVVSYNSGYQINSFGEDEDGDLYLLDNGGSVLRFAP